MDPITHSLTGLTLSNLGLREVAPLASTAVLLSSILPDVDYLTNLKGREAYLKHHRGLSHSILGIAILSLGVSSFLYYFDPLTPLYLYFLLCLLGSGSHLLFDLTTSYGTRILKPLSGRWFAWDLVMIVDPYLMAILGGGLLAASAPGINQGMTAGTSLALIGLYWLGRGYCRHRAIKILNGYRFPEERVLKLGAFPLPHTPFRWHSVLETDKAFYTARIDIRREKNTDFVCYPKMQENDFLRAAREATTIATFLGFARFPWMSYQRNGDSSIVRCEDLRFKYFQGNDFAAEVALSKDGRVVSQELRF